MDGKEHSKHTVKSQSINHWPNTRARATVISDYNDRLIRS